MAVPVAKHQFTTGEVSPSMLGRQDVERYKSSGSTVRNFFASYRGPLYSRAGTAFVGYSKQTGRSFPPRLIPFQFSTVQGLALEFGHNYMRCISNGAYVTEAALTVAAATNSNPVLITLASVLGIATASANLGGVVSSYDTGDSVAVAGGTFATRGVLQVTSTKLVSCYQSTAGTGYVPADTITFAGGTHSVAAIGTVATTQCVTATIAAIGAGGVDGTQTVTGTTGTGTKFQVSVTVTGGAITAILGIVSGGAYTVNPTVLANEPVTGAGLVGAQLSIAMGLQSLTVSTPGVYTVNPVSGVLTQSATSGGGTGGVCVGVFGPLTLSVTTPGQYLSFPASPAGQHSTTGAGLGATFTLTSSAVAPPISVGDWVYVAGIHGLKQLNGEIFVVGSLAGNVIGLKDVFGNTIDTTADPAYTSGGTVSRVFTLVTPYAEADLAWLKFVQSADTMSLCLVNQDTAVEYEPQDLQRFGDTNWSFSDPVSIANVLPPPTVSGSASSGGSVFYRYVITSIDPNDGTESAPSAIISINNAVDIAATAGSITLNWKGASGVQTYFIYKALPSYGSATPTGVQFSYAGFSYGNTFIDSNIVADPSQSPPTHRNPFARGVIFGATAVAGGTGYTKITLTITTGTGSGAVLVGVLQGGALVGVIVQEQGHGYVVGDTVVPSGDGTGAAAVLQIGPQTGTYPGLPAYFQERRGYANSLNAPDTYWFSKPGAFTNFDVRNPVISSDAITGSPWAVQVNGVQWMIQTSGGLLVMTGLRAWMLVGSGSFATNVQPISPANQNNVPQAFTGSSPIIEPILVNFDVIYVGPDSVYFYDLPYQLYALSEPVDLTDISDHLFTGYTVIATAWCEKPYRLVWSVRSDGALLSMTYYKTQKVQGWTRHDTQGQFVGVCSVAEPPISAAYFATKRVIASNTAYIIERMDNRIWPTVEDVWAVDCGLAFPQPTPAANLAISSATGLGAVSGSTGIVTGAGYTAATVGTVVDQFGGVGSGAIPTLTIAGGALTNVTFSGGNKGSGYTQPLLVLVDPAGSQGGAGASAKLTLDNTTTLTAGAAVFAITDVGSIVRGAGGMAVITAFTNATTVTANVLTPFIPPSSGSLVVPNGEWTMTQPISTVSGLRHLAGATVTGLADGNVIPPTVVTPEGRIGLGTPASSVVVGLGFQAQFQDVPIDLGNPTVQGQRKKLTATTIRLDKSRGVKVGCNQQDGASLSPPRLAVTWNNMATLPDAGPGTPNFPPAPYNALCTPLRTGDVRTTLAGGVVTSGQLCVQQDNPLPCNIVAVYSEVLPGDLPQTQATEKKGRG